MAGSFTNGSTNGNGASGIAAGGNGVRVANGHATPAVVVETSTAP